MLSWAVRVRDQCRLALRDFREGSNPPACPERVPRRAAHLTPLPPSVLSGELVLFLLREPPRSLRLGIRFFFVFPQPLATSHSRLLTARSSPRHRQVSSSFPRSTVNDELSANSNHSRTSGRIAHKSKYSRIYAKQGGWGYKMLAPSLRTAACPKCQRITFRILAQRIPARRHFAPIPFVFALFCTATSTSGDRRVPHPRV